MAATHTFSCFFRIGHPFLGTAPDRCNLRLEVRGGHLMHLVFVDLIFLLDICLVLRSYSEVRGLIEIVAVVSSQCRSDSVFLSYAKLLVDRFILGF